jgi:signal transduction histidine kinase
MLVNALEYLLTLHYGFSGCKRIVDAHEGIISLESAVGKGTTFTVTIPKLRLR